jgi:hypothetical protein
MTDRIEQYLDGAVERGALTPGERAEADLIGHVIDETRTLVDRQAAPDLTAAVMRRIEQLGPRPGRRWNRVLARWVSDLWRAREVSFRVRPAYGLVGAAAIGIVFAIQGWRASSVSTVAPPVLVQFRLEAPDASNVRLAGSFTDWQRQYELYQVAPGLWAITIPLPPGVHEYAFLLDDRRWVADPYAPAVDDGFGGTNSRLALVPPEDAPL